MRIIVVLSLFAILAFILALVGATIDKGPFSSAGGSRPVPKSAVLTEWKAKDYEMVLQSTGNSLGSKPIDPFYLVFNGLASFYKSVAMPESDERTALLDNTVVSIRKALATGGKIPVRAQAEYILGKAYYHKGSDYYDLAAEYLEASVSHGYVANDSHEYLGALYAGLRENSKAIAHFEKALLEGKTDLLLLSTAKAYADAGETAKSETLLQEIIASGTDALIREKAGLLLGVIFLGRREFARAEELFSAVLSKNPDSAEAYYDLGLVYQEKGEPVRARAAWRKAVSIDPMHQASRQKLSEKL
jgi:hypothetical protein